MTIDWIFGWWNLVFVAPFFLALAYLGIYAASGVTFGEIDHDTDVNAELDHDFDHDADVDMDADTDVDADHDVEHDVDHDADDGESQSGSSLAGALTWLGIGRVPVSIVLTVLF